MVGTRLSLTVLGGLCAAWCWGASAGGAAVLCGAKLVRAELGAGAEAPRVVVTGGGGAWRVKEGEAWTGVNPREFYFTLEAAEKGAPPPKVEAVWPGVKIARVLGAAGAASNTAAGVAFAMGRGRAPTSVGTSLAAGAIHMHVFHNWEVRRAGKYREGAWPADIIQAQLNYLFAAREMCRAMGFADSDKPGFNGDIRLYGFESNFPNGHVDYPPHFHIMLGWPGWTGTQAGHFLLDGKGQILENRLLADMGGRQESAVYRAGEVCRMRDPDGKVGFELIIEAGGAGVVMRRAAGQPEFRVSAAAGAAGAVAAVDVSRRDAGAQAWTPLCRVRAEDDAAKGRMEIAVTGADGKRTAEVITYDVDTGALADVPASAGRAAGVASLAHLQCTEYVSRMALR